MNKAELVGKVQYAVGDLTKTQTEKVLEALLQAITETVANQERVQLTGFGTFQSVKRAGRQGRNPQTGEVIAIPEHRTVKFVPGKELKNLLTQ